MKKPDIFKTAWKVLGMILVLIMAMGGVYELISRGLRNDIGELSDKVDRNYEEIHKLDKKIIVLQADMSYVKYSVTPGERLGESER